MAVTMTRTCDFTARCTEPAVDSLQLTFDGIAYATDVCAGHRDDLLAAITKLGFRPVASIVDGRRRDVYITASGEPFTTADARAWLIEQGLATERGRISREYLELYASKH